MFLVPFIDAFSAVERLATGDGSDLAEDNFLGAGAGAGGNEDFIADANLCAGRIDFRVVDVHGGGVGLDADAVAARLLDEGVVVRNIPGTPFVRASCGWWTNEDDVERLVRAL